MPLALMNDILANIPNDFPSPETQKAIETNKYAFSFSSASYQLACMRDGWSFKSGR